ncbi:MAG: hypothetical protein NT157_01050 [Candidatus Micrarchaeota archaeon]|nr:hypothetical protein [Candidatus Micrarchaeota archaeon]
MTEPKTAKCSCGHDIEEKDGKWYHSSCTLVQKCWCGCENPKPKE